MSRPCRRIEWSFSSAYDGSLTDAEKLTFDSHLAECTPCREGFAKFVRAMSDLAMLRPSGAVDDSFVTQLMGRVERAGTESGVGRISGVSGPFAGGRRIRAFVSHAVAAAIGIAATLAWGLASKDPHRGPLADVPREEPRPIGSIQYLPRMLPVRFEGEDRSFERNHRVEHVTESFSLRPGETLRSLPSQRVSISLAETGELLIEIERAALQDSGKRVHEIKFVELPSLVTVDRALVDEAVDELERRVVPRLGELDLKTSMASVFDAIARFERGAAPATTDRPTTPLPDPAPDEPEQDTESVSGDLTRNDSPTPSALEGAFEPATFIAGTTPTTIRREPDRTTLSLQGGLSTTIPELIALLDDEDAEIADLAAARLATIREDLELDPRLSGKLSPLPPAVEVVDRREGAFLPWFKNPFVREKATQRDVPAAERWTRWWRDNGLVIATGHRAVDR